MEKEKTIESLKKILVYYEEIIISLTKNFHILYGTSQVKNDNGHQVTVIIPKGVWETVENFVKDLEKEDKGEDGEDVN
jgi:hypothetical protein